MTTEIAGYRFRDGALLATALTHTSYLHEHPEEEADDFERLEFLGDAVVDLVAAEALYGRFADASEGELTALRSQVVSTTGLAAVAERLGLPALARLGRGEEEMGGRQRSGLAASLFESFVGAVYVDGGYEAARELVLKAMAPEIEGTLTAPLKTPKSLLQEWAQSRTQSLPVYRVVEQRGPDHRRDFLVEVEVDGRVARGSGSSKREAQEEAAARLLEDVRQ